MFSPERERENSKEVLSKKGDESQSSFTLLYKNLLYKRKCYSWSSHALVENVGDNIIAGIFCFVDFRKASREWVLELWQKVFTWRQHNELLTC